MRMKNIFCLGIATCTIFGACDRTIDCNPTKTLDTSRGACNSTLTIAPSVTNNVNGTTRTITSNSIPSHQVGLFGSAQGSLNPNAIKAQNETYNITTTPSLASSTTQLLSSTGPKYSFGVLLNGVEVDPVAAEPWPHTSMMDPNVNWTWNLEATNVQIGLDCNNAHVQPQGKYHYHGAPQLYIAALNPSATAMTLIGWAADGFPIYYKYAYTDAQDNSSLVKVLAPSYRLKTGERPGTGNDGPCGTYNGIYSNDYEYVSGLGDLDECNGRSGVTPEFPSGTYYYVLTETFPNIPRCFKGTPSTSFKI